MAYVKRFNLHIVLIIIRRQLSSGSTMTLLFPSVVSSIGSFGSFYTVDHFFLLLRLSARFGICDHALNWLRSYLSDRTQFVRIQDVSSHVNDLPYGVPQGSVLGPLLYSLYTSPLGDIARSYSLSYHFYADDTQLYLSFETSSAEDLSICKSTIEDCVREIDLWMLANKLKLNSNRTEILVFSSFYCPRPALNNLVISSETVDCSTTAKNVGVIFSNSLSMLPHVKDVSKSSFFHLRNIFKVRKFLSYDASKILIHAFIKSRIDYCNSLLYGQPNKFYNVCRVSLIVLQGSFILAVDVNMSLLCLFSFIGSLLNRWSLLKLLSLHSRLFMVLRLTISLSS